MPLMQKFEESLVGKNHIIWDWNGTLLSDVQHAVHTVNHLLESHGLPLIDVHQYRQLFEFPVINYYRKLGFDFSKESFENLCHRFVERFMHGFKELPLITPMKKVLMQLHSEGRIQSVLSATDQINLNSMIDHYELKDIFRFVYGIDNKLAGSKIERGFELIVQSEIDPQRTVIIGDTLHDLDVAKALNIDAILISHGHQNVQRLKEQHFLVIESDYP